MTLADDEFAEEGRLGSSQQPFCPAFCPVRFLDRISAVEDLSCVNCGREFPVGGRERIPRNCGYDVDTR